MPDLHSWTAFEQTHLYVDYLQYVLACLIGAALPVAILLRQELWEATMRRIRHSRAELWKLISFLADTRLERLSSVGAKRRHDLGLVFAEITSEEQEQEDEKLDGALESFRLGVFGLIVCDLLLALACLLVPLVRGWTERLHPAEYPMVFRNGPLVALVLLMVLTTLLYVRVCRRLCYRRRELRRLRGKSPDRPWPNVWWWELIDRTCANSVDRRPPDTRWWELNESVSPWPPDARWWALFYAGRGILECELLSSTQANRSD